MRRSWFSAGKYSPISATYFWGGSCLKDRSVSDLCGPAAKAQCTRDGVNSTGMRVFSFLTDFRFFGLLRPFLWLNKMHQNGSICFLIFLGYPPARYFSSQPTPMPDSTTQFLQIDPLRSLCISRVCVHVPLYSIDSMNSVCETTSAHQLLLMLVT